jgi:protein-S-isoprenylcysteine O-methyltransferase Ste14
MNAPAWIYPAAIAGPWIAWYVYWYVSAYGTKSTARIESVGSRATYQIPLFIGACLIFFPPSLFEDWPWLNLPVLPLRPETYWIGVAILVAGLLFTVWARVHLGRNWSDRITVKQGHELIRSGPYGWVRHPIYTGLLFAFLGSAVALTRLRGFIGVVLFVVAVVRKLRIEERFMREQFGEEYARYAAATAALLPLVY